MCRARHVARACCVSTFTIHYFDLVLLICNFVIVIDTRNCNCMQVIAMSINDDLRSSNYAIIPLLQPCCQESILAVILYLAIYFSHRGIFYSRTTHVNIC